jgi:hypothetical protein
MADDRNAAAPDRETLALLRKWLLVSPIRPPLFSGYTHTSASAMGEA